MKELPLKNYLLFCFLLVFSSNFMTAEDLSKIYTVHDYFNFEWVSDPQISPDGSKIIYVRNFMDITTDKFYSNLWIINFNGTDNRPLTSGLYQDSSPRWSPDGRQIIYLSDKDGKPQIHKRWMDTGETVVLTNLLFPPTNITWSPDSKWIAFSAPVPAMPRKVAQMPPAPPGAKWAPPPRIVDKLVYRFDGVGYQISMGYMHIFVMPADGGTPRQLSQGNFNHPLPMFGGGIDWTPDSKHILLSACRRDESDLEMLDTEIYEFSVADGKMKALTKRHGPDNIAEISPDGKYVAYTGYDEKYMGYQTARLYIMNRDGSRPRCITKDFDRSVSSVKWAGDGKGLYLIYDNTGRTRLGYVSLGGKIKELADTLGDGRVAYGGTGAYAVSPNGNLAFTYSEPDHASDIAVLTAKNPKVRLITSVNEDIFGHKALATVEAIWYKSSHDGRKIQGWIMKPPHFDPSKKYPLILEIHGGPWASYGEYFSIEKQLLASAGYVVLYTNPRGSTGYGYEFANLIHHDYPGNDYYDLMSGVDAMLEKDYIDKDNLFITGGSGGGVLTCWVIGQTDRFRAAATLYPVVNWYSTALTSDIAFRTVKWHMPGMPWDHAEHYMKRSPISLAGNVKTPAMVMCGEEDWRCPIIESEQYYMALKLQGIEAVLVRYPGASHGIYNRPSQHMSKMQHIIAWFDQHKKKAE